MEAGNQNRLRIYRGSAALTLLLTAAAMAADDAAMPPAAPAVPPSAEVQATASPDPVAAPEVTPLPYAVVVNGKPSGDALLLQLPDGRLLARSADLDRWRLKHAGDAEFVLNGEAYQLLARSPGFSAHLDPQNQRAELDFAPQAFELSQVRVTPSRITRAQRPQGLGGFLNYDLLASEQQLNQSGSNSSLNGQLEAVLFNRWGVLSSQWIGLNLNGDQPGSRTASSVFDEQRILRLESSFVRDDPDALTTLTLGDAIGASGLFGRPVRFGGVRWARNFSTQPGFITLPQPALSGETALPSALDVYVNGVRQQSLTVPSGPFQIDALPVINGQGEVQVVVRDLLGREQIISQSYFTGTRQLKAGLHDFSYEFGAQRQRFGVASEDYGALIAIGTHSYGFSEHLTGELRGEFAGNGLQGIGAGGILALAPVGVFSGGLALSHSGVGNGVLGLLGFERQLRRGLNLGARVQLTSPDYRQAGQLEGFAPPERIFSSNLGYGIAGFGRFGLSYTNIKNRSPEQLTSVLAGSFTTRYKRVSINLTALDRFEPSQDYSVSLNFNLPLGNRQSASAGYRYQQNENRGVTGQTYARVQRNLPEGAGWGYRASVSELHGGNQADGVNAEAGVKLNAEYGSYGLELARFDQLNAYRASLSGGLGLMSGYVFASRKLNSFAIVETGAEDLKLLLRNQLVTRTNADGVAVLPYLQPYQSNNILIDPTDLPLSVLIPSAGLDAVPYYKSGLLLKMPARKTLGAVLAMVQANGRPVPTGASIKLSGSDVEFPVGYRGRAYVNDLKVGENQGVVSWASKTCAVRFSLSAQAGFQPDIGPVICTESAQ